MFQILKSTAVILLWLFLVITGISNILLIKADNDTDNIADQVNKTNPFLNLPEQSINNTETVLNKVLIQFEDEDKCPESCPNIHEPVCGCDGSCFRTFTNPCEVLRENCNRSWWNKFNITQKSNCSANNKPNCEHCPEKCIKESNPICGYNKYCYQTFYSTCQMLRQNCITGGKEMFEVFAQGECPIDEQMPICRQSCPKSCQQELCPVCGKKEKCYQSFFNECYLDRTNCLLSNGGIEFNFIHTGNCLPEEMQNSEGC